MHLIPVSRLTNIIRHIHSTFSILFSMSKPPQNRHTEQNKKHDKQERQERHDRHGIHKRHKSDKLWWSYPYGVRCLLTCPILSDQCQDVVRLIYSYQQQPQCQGIYVKTVPHPDAGKHHDYYDDPFWCATCPDTGRIFVADTFKSCVNIITSDGLILKTFGGKGRSNGKCKSMQQIAVANQELYALDKMLSRVNVFDLDGNFLRKLDIDKNIVASVSGIAVWGDYIFVASACQKTILMLDNEGKLLHQCFCMAKLCFLDYIALKLTVMQNGNLIVTNDWSGQMLLLDTSKWFDNIYTNTPPDCPKCCKTCTVVKFDVPKADYAGNPFPKQSAVSHDGREIFVVEDSMPKIHVFSIKGELLRSFSISRRLVKPSGIALSSDGVAIVYDVKGANIFK